MKAFSNSLSFVLSILFLESSIESKSLYFNSDFHGFVLSIYFLLKMNRTKSHRPKNKARKSQIPPRLPQLQSCFRKKSKNWLNKQNFRMRKKEKPFCICKSNKMRVGLLMKYNFRSKVDSLPRGSKVWTMIKLTEKQTTKTVRVFLP